MSLERCDHCYQENENTSTCYYCSKTYCYRCGDIYDHVCKYCQGKEEE